ncbi:hypothetical protein Rhe02_28640 [Rhizocola hellebori]|uniref:SD-repeat containing protein B domain-containing protein n=1 Tax=Rhizocola hellebori TaxID=1392758 RepID=A0A8J3VG62_9ACTN|nr:SdrD B-like domain-containing protein [Rhizocola hellebori]GIH04797.1 hypothetical protein Rhe02_28640 [Rhizocola hellebori]
MFVVAPAAAAATITVKLEPKYLVTDSVRPTVTISGASGNSTLAYRRYNNGDCEGSPQMFSSVSAANGTHTGPDLQTGNPGPHSLRVSYGGLNAPCQPFLVQRKVTAVTALPKNTFESSERVEPGIALSGGLGNAAGQVEVGRWPAAGCGPGKATSVSILPVTGQPQGSVNLQDGSLGTKSFAATYSGDERHTEAAAACRDYTVGAFIRGKVFEDADGSATADAGEAGKAGVVITLRRPQGSTATATTIETGAYEFFVTASGKYTLIAAPPPGFDKTTNLELQVQMVASSVGEQNFGVVELPSTLLPFATAAPQVTGGVPTLDGLEELSTSSEGFALIRLLALGLVVIAALVLLWLIFAARSRREDDPF